MQLDMRVDDQDPTRVVLLLNGKFLCFAPWRIADEIASKLRGVARLCEENEKANQIVIADALLIRSGAPFSFTSNPKIRDAAYNEAQWGKRARHDMPMRGVPSARRLGTPTILKTPPLPGDKRHG